MMVVCAFGHEEIPDGEVVKIEVGGRSANICPRCLTLITVHRRYHHMDLEKLIFQMAKLASLPGTSGEEQEQR